MSIQRSLATVSLLATLFSAHYALAGGALLQNASITKVNVGVLNSDSVQILTSGGTGVCAGASIVFFIGNYSPARIQYATQVALAAYLSGRPVDIYDDMDATPTSSSCNNASEIAIHN